MLNFHTLTIFRLTESDESGDTYGRELAATGSSITGFLSQASASFTALVDGDIGRTYVFATDDFDSDVAIGDELRESGVRYQVKGIDTATDGPGRKRTITLTKPIEQ